MPVPLVDLDDLERFLGRTLTGSEALRASDLIDQASATVRLYTRQTISQAETTDRITIDSGMGFLPQRPVTAIDSVQTIFTPPVDVAYAWDGDQIIWVPIGSIFAFDVEPFSQRRPVKVDVTYTHGYEQIPADIKAVTLQIVSRALGRKPEDGGLVQEAIDGYSYQQGSTAAAGPVGLLDAEKAVLDAYRRHGATIPVI